MSLRREREERSSSAAERMEQLFRAHHRAVVAYVCRRAPSEIVDDVVAETFLVAWRRLEEVPPHSLPWLLAVARNVIGTQRRGETRRRALDLRLRDREQWEAVGPTDVGEGRAPIAAALAGLSEKDREALILIAWDGLKPREAANVLGESPSTFRVRLHRARRRLRRRLRDLTDRAESPTPRALEAQETTP